MTDGGVMGDGKEARKKAAEPPNRMKFSTAPVKSRRGGREKMGEEGGEAGGGSSDGHISRGDPHFCTGEKLFCSNCI